MLRVTIALGCLLGLVLSAGLWPLSPLWALVLGFLQALCFALTVWDEPLPRVRLPRPRLPWRLLGRHVRRARRRAGGHWECWFKVTFPAGEAWWEWRPVTHCHHEGPCPFDCDWRCGLVRCEHYGGRLGDNAIEAEPDPAWEQRLLQAERALRAWEHERAQEEWERLRERRRRGPRHTP